MVVSVAAIVAMIGVSGCSRRYQEEAHAKAKLSNLTTNLMTIRAQLEFYTLHHDGKYPADVVEGLTKKTDAGGVVSAVGEFGPYIHVFPANPFVNDPDAAVKTSGADGDGWFYNPNTGEFRPNSPGHEGL